ncbi:MAG: hypothetical protein JZD41_00620 [Thermoproteus sp.]|nr:hypothetical protein [Thermoproteus sp.]
MIGLYADKLIDTSLPLLVPSCRAARPNVIPYVADGLPCLLDALSTAYAAVAVKTDNKLLIRIAQEMRPGLLILVDGLRVRGSNVRPLLRPGEPGRGYFLVDSKDDLRRIDGARAEGLFLYAEAFDPSWVELAASGGLRCACGSRCDIKDLLLCGHRELEIL